ncbi:hypothetical protein [Fuchsiella alkaliacetigena]|uniref:hypothetical protein n=1 Tax=Fuchsiella alkaliacetigena TaxID=957042 RepID=UPI00200B20FB|nr:hypothetical protein [Fuchsiella alkaliacetigena]MCK8825129.1 hypothetical protein [Fuchsiella alkaliacetigena]
MILTNLAGPFLLLLGTILMLLVVEWEAIKELLLFGIFGGFGIGLALNYIMQNVFGFWIFQNADLINFFGIPILLSAAWTPVIIIFAYLIINSDASMNIGTLLAFPLAAALVQYLLTLNQMLTLNNWNLVFSYLLSLTIHAGLIGALYLIAQFDTAEI